METPSAIDDLPRVQIERLVYEGDGLGRLPSGEVIFIPFSAPGDDVLVSVETRRKRVLHGQINHIESPSEDRIDPRCSVFGECGGCHWQHISLPAQHQWKQAIVQESLARLGGLRDVAIQPILSKADASVEPGWFYRSKVEWLVEDGRLGYARRQSHDLVAFDRCWIVPDSFNALAAWFREHPAVLAQVYRIQVRTNEAQELLVTVYCRDDLPEDVVSLFHVDMPSSFPKLAGVVVDTHGRETCLVGEPYLLENIGPYVFEVTPQSFFQVNPKVTQCLMEAVSAMVLPDTRTLVDIYAGVGLFGIGLHRQFERVVLVESSPHAVQNARRNLAHNQIVDPGPVEILQGGAEEVLQALDEGFDVAVIDPPRQGCQPDVLAWLTAHVRRQVLYVSCNPTTLARDLKLLVQDGWQIQTIQPLDMFPQTYHIETVVSLTRPA